MLNEISLTLKRKTIIASTANPFKFSGSVLSAISTADGMSEFEMLDKLSALTENKIPASLDELRTKAPRFDKKINKEAMPEAVKEFLGI